MRTALNILLVAMALNYSSLTFAVEYTFTRVYTGPAQPGVAINDNGLVALIFGGALDSTLITTDGKNSTIIADSRTLDGYESPWLIQVLCLNNSGFVAFKADSSLYPGLERGLFKSDGTDYYTLAEDYSCGGSFSNIGSCAVSINDAGMVAFTAYTTDTYYPVYLTDGTSAPVQLNDHPAQTPAINNSDTVAYRFFDSRIQTYYPVEIQSGSETISLPGTVINSMPDINDHGVVAFCATIDGVEKVVVGDGVSSPTFIDGSRYYLLTDGWWIDGFGSPSCAINNQGLVVFGATTQSDPYITGIFTGPDPIADKVIQAGDLLDDFAVEILSFSRNGLNNLGQIAFWAELSDGTTGVWVATPVPEPSTFILLAAGAIGLLGHAWRRRISRLR